jgi:hypothetical protein
VSDAAIRAKLEVASFGFARAVVVDDVSESAVIAARISVPARMDIVRKRFIMCLT